jgi:hypothetical protein
MRAGDLRARCRVERRKSGAPALCQRELALPAVAVGDDALDQPLPAKPAQDSAQIAGIEAQLAPDLRRGDALAMSELVQHARFGQREPAVEQALT